MHADPIKYEVDKKAGALFVDRFVSTAMRRYEGKATKRRALK